MQVFLRNYHMSSSVSMLLHFHIRLHTNISMENMFGSCEYWNWASGTNAGRRQICRGVSADPKISAFKSSQMGERH